MQGKELSGPFSLFIPRIFGWLIDSTTLQNNIPMVQYVLHFVTLNFKQDTFTSYLVLQKRQGPSTETIWYSLIYIFWGNKRLQCLTSAAASTYINILAFPNLFFHFKYEKRWRLVINFWCPGLASTISFVRKNLKYCMEQCLVCKKGWWDQLPFPCCCTHSISKYSNELGCYSFPTAKVNTKTFRPCWSPHSCWCIDSTRILSDCTAFAHNIYKR